MTDDQLMADALLPRTAFPSLTKWQDVMSHSLTRVCTSWQDQYDNGAPVDVNDSLHQPAQPARPSNAGNYIYYDPSWTGYISPYLGALQHSAASTYIYIPCSEADLGYHAASLWVGQSGYYGNPLLQAGVIIKSFGYSVTYQLFYENTGNGGERDWVTNPCNSTIYAYATGNYVYMTEYVFGRVLSRHVNPIVASDSSECMAEHVSDGNGGYYLLEQFQTATFNYCTFEDQNGNWHSFEDFPTYETFQQNATHDGTPWTWELMILTNYSRDSDSPGDYFYVTYQHES